MKASDCPGVVFDPAALLPDAWQSQATAGPVRTFNPGLLRDPAGAGWLLAYRVVAPDGARRIAISRLKSDFGLVDGSAVALTDRVRFRPGAEYPDVARRWFADPRLYWISGRLFIYWNSGWHEPRNYQFLQELEPRTLEPVGEPRELLLRGERQKLEKNWTLFSSGRDELFAVYSIGPHRVLRFALEGEGDIVFDEVIRTEIALSEFPPCHGGLRGGAPPVLHQGRWWSFCHSVHDGSDGYVYAPAAYAFSAVAPFAPVLLPRTTLSLHNPFGGQRTHERLNPAVGEVIYPCGAARDGTRWVVSHGLNDEYCALSFLSDEVVRATLRPVHPEGTGPAAV